MATETQDLLFRDVISAAALATFRKKVDAERVIENVFVAVSGLTQPGIEIVQQLHQLTSSLRLVTTFDFDHIAGSIYEPNTVSGVIEELETGYVVRKPIPYSIKRMDEGNHLATFDEANIAVGGVNQHDAYQALVAEILDTFDTLAGERRLSIPAAHQFEILSGYLAKS